MRFTLKKDILPKIEFSWKFSHAFHQYTLQFMYKPGLQFSPHEVFLLSIIFCENLRLSFHSLLSSRDRFPHSYFIQDIWWFFYRFNKQINYFIDEEDD